MVSPLTSIGYHDAVRHRLGDPSAWYRLFLVPGMGHCGGGPGLTQFDSEAAIERWVEQDGAPDRLIAHRSGEPSVTRPLCPYPARATLRHGLPGDAQSFVCIPSPPRAAHHSLQMERASP